MIRDPEALTRVRKSWDTVRVVDAMIATNMNAGIFSLVPKATGFSAVPESLLLVFAVAVLEEVLRELRDQGAFPSTRNALMYLMNASRSALPWQNFVAVDGARDRRNRVAHQHQLLAQGEYSAYLDAIETELVAWRVLDGPVRKTFTVSMTPSS